jgi:hypothetical protein
MAVDETGVVDVTFSIPANAVLGPGPTLCKVRESKKSGKTK